MRKDGAEHCARAQQAYVRNQTEPKGRAEGEEYSHLPLLARPADISAALKMSPQVDTKAIQRTV